MVKVLKESIKLPITKSKIVNRKTKYGLNISTIELNSELCKDK